MFEVNIRLLATYNVVLMFKYSVSTLTHMQPFAAVVVEFDPATYTVTESEGAFMMFRIVKRTNTTYTTCLCALQHFTWHSHR